MIQKNPGPRGRGFFFGLGSFMGPSVPVSGQAACWASVLTGVPK
ncbi:hypothetical protein RR11_1935 [Ruegeria sp. R11]|nr:hypothetical protein RR11_1935 [Ruegeria sp. R11]